MTLLNIQSESHSEFGRSIANLFRARFSFLYVATWEETRLITIIRAVAKNEDLIKTPRAIFEWGIVDGFREDMPKNKNSASSALSALEFIESYEEAAIFILKDFHVYFGANNRPPDVKIVRKILDLLPILKQSKKPKNVVFVSSVVLLPPDLEKAITLVDFQLPSFAEIQSVLRSMIERNRNTGKINIDLDDEGQERLAQAALGLTLHEAENAFARAMVEDGQLDIGDVDVILEEKRQTIKKSGILDFIKSDLDINDVGGLENLKRWLRKRNKSWLDSASRYNLPAPKGVLITGIPGCGKSLIAKSVASMWQLPLLRLDVGRIFAGIVGSSEENMRQAIRTAEAIAPCVLWIDEIEKGFGGVSARNGDGGTSTRVFGTFLTWMQEKTKAVFVVATANNISALPSEMMRKGRFDEIFFVDLPTEQERIEIFKLHLKRRLTHPDVTGSFVADDTVLARLSKLTSGYVGAEIEQIVISGLFEAFYESRSVKCEDFERAIEITVPLTVTQGEHIQVLRDWANVRAVTASKNEKMQEKSSAHDIGTAASAGTAVPPPSSVGTRGGRDVDF